MADKESAPERIVIIDQNEAARRAAAERLAAGNEPAFKPVPPGGVYRTADGRFHDAHGREVTEDGKLVSDTNWELPPASTAQVGGPDVTDAAAEGASDEANEWREDMKAQRRESMDNPVEGAPLFGDSVLPPLDDDEEGGEDKPRKKSRKRSE